MSSDDGIDCEGVEETTGNVVDGLEDVVDDLLLVLVGFAEEILDLEVRPGRTVLIEVVDVAYVVFIWT